MSKKPRERIYAFIDSQNLNLGIRDQGWRLDFARFRVYLKEKYKVSKAFLFIGRVPGNESLYKFLKKSDYAVIFKPTLESKDRDGKSAIKGNVDTELAMYATLELPNYDKAIIVTGDGDFYCLVEMLKGRKKLGRVLVPNRAKYSRLLAKFIKEMDFMNNLKNKLGYKKAEVSP